MKKIIIGISTLALSIYGASKLFDSFKEAPKTMEKSTDNLMQFTRLSQYIPQCMSEFNESTRYRNLPRNEQTKIDFNLYNDINKSISFGMAACGTEQYRIGIELAFSSAKTIYLPTRVGAIDTILGEMNDADEKLCGKAVNLINLYCPVKARMTELK